MIGADLALAGLINRTNAAFSANPPRYMTYVEDSHIVGNGQHRDINRSVALRVADDYAVMHDLPQGAERVGEAFPILPYIDLFSQFQYCWFANLKAVDITFVPGALWYLKMPDPDPSVDLQVPYFSQWAPRYAPDSTDALVHLIMEPSPRLRDGNFYPVDVVEDPATQLPSHVAFAFVGRDETLAFDYGMVQGHWVATKAVWSATQHVFVSTFKVTATTTFSDFTFPDTAPDPRLATPPSPKPSATCAP
ncbi:MAG TPA: hypothetical protein VFN49_07675 [Candidatus Aquilonibacter sp.]|nr:hypothetical protein [Candidatus Aquilonibacter sp.]